MNKISEEEEEEEEEKEEEEEIQRTAEKHNYSLDQNRETELRNKNKAQEEEEEEEKNEELQTIIPDNKETIMINKETIMINKDKNTDIKDPMRDSLMSDSDEGEEEEDDDDEGRRGGGGGGGGFSDDDDDLTTHKETNDNSLDLEFDLWEGQFEISRPRYPPSYGYFKDIVKTVQMLQQQVGVLAENQSNTDDRYSRVRQDNAAYQERTVMLEEQLREAEHRYEERRAEEQRRNRELLTRVEREKQLTIENFTIKLASLEKDKGGLEEEVRRTKVTLDKLQKEKEDLEDRVSEAEFTASALTQGNAKLQDQARRREGEGEAERERSAQVIEELRCEVERLRAAEEAAEARRRAPSVDASSSSPPPPELQAALRRLREDNKGLEEQVEDLQAQLLTSHLEEGRTLVTTTNNNSLAAEFEAMTSQEGIQFESDTVEKLRKSLKDSQEANHHLRAYIDGILLNIVENYPQLLEVKQPK